jgi:hypothetical protein
VAAAGCIGPFDKLRAGSSLGVPGYRRELHCPRMTRLGGDLASGITIRSLRLRADEASAAPFYFCGLFGLGLPEFCLAAHQVVAFAGGLL